MDSEIKTQKVLRAIETLFDRHLHFQSQEDHDAVVLWTATQWLASELQSFGRLYFQSGEPGSGKTAAMELVCKLSREEIILITPTPAVVYRVIEKLNEPPTIGIDEADTIWGKAGSASSKSELLGVVNSGYKAAGSVWRARGTDDVGKFRTYAPIVLAGLGTLPDALYTRCVTIPMEKAGKDVKLTPYDEMSHGHLFAGVRDHLESWSLSVRHQIRNGGRPDMPEGVVGRPAEVWYGMIKVADLAGTEWGERARAACKTLLDRKPPKGDARKAPGAEFLDILQGMFESEVKVFSADVAKEMSGDVTANRVRKLAEEHGVTPKKIRKGNRTGAGLIRDDFEGIFEMVGRDLE